MGMITAAWSEQHGLMEITVSRTPQEIAAGLVLMRTYPRPRRTGVVGSKIPFFDYESTAATMYAVDVGVNPGGRYRYGLTSISGTGTITAQTPYILAGGLGSAYMRDLFIPARSLRLRIVSLDEEQQPARHTIYQRTGRAYSIATYGPRGGREATLVLQVVGAEERAALEELLSDGVPVSLSVCASIGFEPGCWMVGDVQWRRQGTGRARGAAWLVTLPLIEVDAPVVVGEHEISDLPLATYASIKTKFNPPTPTYAQVADRYPSYYDGIWERV